MLFESENFGKDLDELKEAFEKMDEQVKSVENIISTFCSNVKSPTAEYFKTATKNVESNHDIMLNHFKNTQEYLTQVKDNYDH